MADTTPFYLEAVGGDVLVSLESHGENLPAVTLEVSSNGTSGWTSFPVDGTKLTIPMGERRYFRSGYAGNSCFGVGPEDYRCFVIDSVVEESDIWMEELTVMCASGGNIMSLLSRSFSSLTTISTPYCFSKLFQACDRLTSAPSLPAATLSDGCYHNMFAGCNRLVYAPSLAHVTTLADSCFSYMFADCMVMAGTAELPTASVELKDCCYEGMFSNCAITAVTGFAFQPTMKYKCFDNMFYGCSALTNEGLPFGFSLSGVTLEESCFAWMFSGTGLTSAPPMPGNVELKECCFESMFEFCLSLTSASTFRLYGDVPYACCRNMFFGCNNLKSTNLNNSIFYSVKSLSDECFQSMFSECSGLLSTPVLPGSGVSGFALADNCYSYMFSYCTSLTSVSGFVPGKMAPGCFGGMFSGCLRLSREGLSGFSIFGVTELAEDCFREMFFGCEMLDEIPQMPSCNLASHCFDSMFSGCTGIGSISGFSLPSKMADGCCANMFSDCVSLTSSGVGNGLFNSVSECAIECFYGMFQGCTSLENAPSIPSVAMAEGCCSYMFSGCKLLKSVNTLASTSLAAKCYSYMFSGCTSLETSPSILASELVESCCRCMFNGCSSLSTIGTIEAFSPGGVMGYGACYGMFYNCIALTNAPSIEVLRLGEYCFGYMFAGCAAIEETPVISATALEKYCCAYMFYNCSGLTTIDSVVSLSDENASLAQYCCTHMFDGCEALEDIPVLNAKDLSLATGCYLGMFNGCKGLKSLKAGTIKATTLGVSCYESMFSGCTGLGSDENVDGLANDALPATVLADACYKSMFKGCTNLKSSVDLPATDLAESCYEYMFGDCTNLETMREISAFSDKSATFAPKCCARMFYNCGNLIGLSTQISASTVSAQSFSYMFYGCSKLSSACVRIGTTDVNCCEYMFSRCIGLKKAYVSSRTLSDYCFYNMFNYCSVLEEAYAFIPQSSSSFQYACDGMFSYCRKLDGIDSEMLSANLTLSQYCYQSMFNGCTSLKNFIDYNNAWEISGDIPSNITYRVIQSRTGNPAACNYYLVIAPSSYSGTFTPFDVDYLTEMGYIRAQTVAADDAASLTFSGTRSVTATGDVASGSSWRISPSDYGSEDFYFAVGVTHPYGIPRRVSVYEDYGYGVSASANINLSYAYYKDETVYIYPYRSYTVRDRASFGTKWSFSESAPSGKFYDVWLPNKDLSQEDSPARLVLVERNQASRDNASACPYAWVTVLARTTVNSGSGNHIDFDVPFTLSASRTEAKISMSLPATSLAKYCYSQMFSNCSSMTGMPSIRVADLSNADGCYSSMFSGCKSLVTAGEKMYATTLSPHCYESMFSGCSSLAFIPRLEVEDLTGAESCYKAMFQNCTGLKDISDLRGDCALWATTLSPNCYESMFDGCSGIKSFFAIDGNSYKYQYTVLKATVMKESCYKAMFRGCTLLEDIHDGYGSGLLHSSSLANRCYESMFERCTSLVSAPALAATAVAEYCYSAMFENCSSLTSIPELPATDLSVANGCYSYMFYGCTGLTSIPANRINGTVIGDSCYYGMFYQCTGLGSVYGEDGIASNALPSTTIGRMCYAYMFYGCENLIDIPQLPATDISAAEYCYYYMFAGCSRLRGIQANKIKATKLGSHCFSYMFHDCTGLGNTAGVEGLASGALPATKILDGCYSYMFSGCTKLKSVPAFSFSSVGSEGCYNMFYNCPGITSVSSISADSVGSRGFMMMFSGCYGIASVQTITVGSAGPQCFQQMFENCGKASGSGSGRTYEGLQDAPEVSVTSIDYQCFMQMFKGCKNLYNASGISISMAEMTAQCCYQMFSGCERLHVPPTMPSNASMSTECFYQMFQGCGYKYEYTENGENIVVRVGLESAPSMSASTTDERCFYQMFQGCVNLSDASRLNLGGVDKLADSCCYEMFLGCDILEYTPTMPTSSAPLAPSCYYGMFKDCKGLANVPDLRATVLDTSCYEGMFYGCTGLEDATGFDLSGVTMLYDSCCYEMFSGCTSLVNSNSIHKIPTFPSIDLAPSCFFGMYSNCTSIEVVPSLAYTKLSTSCYRQMFKGCTGLTMATGFALGNVTEFAESCCCEMFSGCTSLVKSSTVNHLPSFPSRKLANECFLGMFSGCTGIVVPPALPSTDLAMSCYAQMFKNCTSMTSAPALSATVLAEACYDEMFSGCTSLTLSGYTLNAENMETDCYRYMFYGCVGLKRTSSNASITLRAKKMAERCCYGMFAMCSNSDFKYAQNILPTYGSTSSITSLAKSCFEMMFRGCTNLTNAPYLPSGKYLPDSCYAQMFYECSSLTSINGIQFANIPKMEDECCRQMFYGCTSLNASKIISTSTIGFKGCYQMFYGCVSMQSPWSMSAASMGGECCYEMYRGCSGLLYASSRYISATDMGEKCCYNMFYGCGSSNSRSWYTPYMYAKWFSSYNKYINVSEIMNGRVNVISGNGETFPLYLEDELNPRTFDLVVCMGDNAGFTLNMRDTRSPDTELATFLNDNYDEISVVIEGGKFYALRFVETSTRSNVFVVSEITENPGYSYSGLDSAPEISVTRCGDYCFYRMFYDCKNMRDAGRVNLGGVSNINKYCCYQMFNGCENLIVPPILPSNAILGDYCFYDMFDRCGSEFYVSGIEKYYGLGYAPAFSAKKLGSSCCYDMFRNCYHLSDAGGVDFSRVESMKSSCCREMFLNCYDLGDDDGSSDPRILIPKLAGSDVPLAEYCYYSMFYNCIKMRTSPDTPALVIASNCYANMFRNSGILDAPELPSVKMESQCYSNMFRDCAGIGTGSSYPVILATSTASNAMSAMFYNCTNLDKIKIALMSDPSDSDVFNSWAGNVKASGTLYVPTGSTVNAMVPSGWSKSTY